MRSDPDGALAAGLPNLAQQMGISAAELRHRKELLGFTPAHAESLAGLRAIALAEVDGLVEEFCRRQLAVPAIRALIGDRDTILRLGAAMRAYVLRMFEGSYDIGYANSRLRVGQVHARLGVAPNLYIAALHMLESLVEERIGKTPCPALHKLFLLDLQFAFDAYVHGLSGELARTRDEIRHHSQALERAFEERMAEALRDADTDPLSGLRSRRGFEAVFAREWEIALATGVDLTIAVLDLDGFKRINDSKGHLEGDRVIQVVGQVIAAARRSADFAFRIGGDEFCLILPMTGRREATAACERLRARIGEALGGEVTISYGLAALRGSGAAMPRDLLAEADRALYRMKAAPGPARGGALLRVAAKVPA